MVSVGLGGYTQYGAIHVFVDSQFEWGLTSIALAGLCLFQPVPSVGLGVFNPYAVYTGVATSTAPSSTR